MKTFEDKWSLNGDKLYHFFRPAIIFEASMQVHTQILAWARPPIRFLARILPSFSFWAKYVNFEHFLPCFKNSFLRFSKGREGKVLRGLLLLLLLIKAAIMELLHSPLCLDNSCFCQTSYFFAILSHISLKFFS